MNNLLRKMLGDVTPKFNKDVVDGSIKKTFKTFPEYLDSILTSSIVSLSSNVDLKYLGIRRVTPRDEINKIIMSSENNIQYDIARNDIYLIELKFSYMGTVFSRYLYLPYADKGNIIRFSNTPYHVIPVLSDTIISPNHKEVFIRLLKAKLSFKSNIKNFILNGEKTPGEVIHCQILRVNEAQIVDNIGKPLVATAIYLTAELGFKEAFRKYCNIDDIFITYDEVDKFKDEYDVYESARVKPRGHKETVYIPHSVKICVRKGSYNTESVQKIIFGILYVFDMFPNTANEIVDVINKHDINTEVMYWKMHIASLSYKNSFSMDRMYDDVLNHFDALEGYIDNDVRAKLKDTGKHIDTFFDLIALVLENYSLWIMNSKEYNSSIENRYIDVKYYILYDIIIGFNRILLNLNKRAGKKQVTMKEVQSLFKSELKPKTILSLTKSSSMNLAIQVASYTGDIMYPKITSVLEDLLVFVVLYILI